MENTDLTPKGLSLTLRELLPGLKGFDAIKTYYRPYICPYHKIISEVKPNESVFDIGFGNGVFLLLLSKFLNPNELAGVEIDEAKVKLTKELFKTSGLNQNNLFIYDGIDLPVFIKNYNWVSMVDVFHHVPLNQQKDFIIELYKKMGSGSKLLFKDIDAGRKFLLLFNKLHDLILTKETGFEVSADNAVSILAESGFKIIKKNNSRMFWYEHYTIIAEKP